MAEGLACWVARRAIWTAREGEARVYFVDSGRSQRMDQISRRSELKEDSGGGEEVGWRETDSSLYRRRQSWTEMRSRKSFRKLFKRGTSKRNVEGKSVDDEGDNKLTNARN